MTSKDNGKIDKTELERQKVQIAEQIQLFLASIKGLRSELDKKKEEILLRIKLEEEQKNSQPDGLIDETNETTLEILEENTDELSNVETIEQAEKISEEVPSLDVQPVTPISEPEITVYYPPVEGKYPKQYQKPNTNISNSNDFRKPNRSENIKTSIPINIPQPINNPNPKGIKKPGKPNIFTDTDSDSPTINKKTKLKNWDSKTKNNIEFEDEEKIVRIRTKKTGSKKKSEFNLSETKVIDYAIIDKKYISVKELSEKIGKTGVEICKQLLSLDIVKTINEIIDFDTAELVAKELGVTLELRLQKTSEEIITEYHDNEEEKGECLEPRPPIVTIMGHVDHGKTSILDYIRKAHVAVGEAGGITQHIGAYSVRIKEQQITFIDTPGHAAFTSMRERGANVTDIVVIVVAADDGIMPQTIEAINHSKAAKVNIIVAINKIDRKGIDIDKVLTQLSEQGLVPEEWGGNIPCVRVSAKTGEGITQLLETILITSEVMELCANPNRSGKGTIIEARLDARKGPIATVIVQNGTLKIGDYIVAGTITGKIRAMHDEKGELINAAGPSTAVAILGLKDVPNAGDNLMAVDDEKLTKQVADERIALERVNKIKGGTISLEDLYKGFTQGELASVNLIVKGDVQGSVEALKSSLEQLSNAEVKVNVLQAIPGSINESDVTLAKTTGSIIIGFNVRPDSKAKISAENKNVDIRLYRIIYDALDDVQNAINGLLKPVFREEYLGKAEVRAVYKIPGVGGIAGCMVKDGKIVRNANVRLIRADVVAADTMITSLKRVKDDAKEVAAGFECGIGLKDFHDFVEGDIIESFKLVQK